MSGWEASQKPSIHSSRKHESHFTRCSNNSKLLSSNKRSLRKQSLPSQQYEVDFLPEAVSDEYEQNGCIRIEPNTHVMEESFSNMPMSDARRNTSKSHKSRSQSKSARSNHKSEQSMHYGDSHVDQD